MFLDFDGTLVELAESPDGIVVPPALADLLKGLSARLDGRLAIVSGRAIGNLEKHLDCAGIAVSGSHGLELRLPDGTSAPLAARGELELVSQRIEAFASDRPGLVVEKKPASVALHYRQAPEQAGQVESFMENLASSAGLCLQPGKMVVEIRPHGRDKGDAVRAFMAKSPFAGALPIFIGDDITDEHAFAAASELGGAGILVGAARPTAAKYRLDDVGSVAQWLGASIH